MLNIVVPMAGAGSRFVREGFKLPKPLITIHGVPMISVITQNIRPTIPHRFIYICQRAHAAAYELPDKLAAISPGSIVHQIDGLTEGAACTVLSVRHLIDNNVPLMIANSDQYVDIAIDDYLAAQQGLDGLIMTMTADDPKWSFARLKPDGLVETVVEKQVVSPHATVGIYNFIRGSDFVRAADLMIAADLRVNNEFYVAPVYNELITQGARIGVYNVGSEGNGMYGLGIPPDLESFARHEVSRRATLGLGGQT